MAMVNVLVPKTMSSRYEATTEKARRAIFRAFLMAWVMSR
jgi:hypothetical protein